MDVNPKRIRRLGARTCFVCTILLPIAPASSLAQAQFIQCRPVEVMTFQQRVEVRCAQAPEPGIIFFAIGTSDPRFAARVFGLMSAAQLTSTSLNILSDMSDRSGVRIGCLTQNCRLIQAIGIVNPTPLLASANEGFAEAADASVQTGSILTSDGDDIRYEIVSGAVSSDRVSFELCLAHGLTWEKRLSLPDGEGNSGTLVVRDQTRCAAGNLRTDQVDNGQSLTFVKAKELGRLVEVHKLALSSLGSLPGGSRVRFTWVKDAGGPPAAPPVAVSSGARTGGFDTADGDRIWYEITPSAVTSDVVMFELCLGPGLTWEKVLLLPDGEGASWALKVKDQTTCAEEALWAHQVNNGQSLIFGKLKAPGVVPVHQLPLSSIGSLPGGSRVKFTWVKDG